MLHVAKKYDVEWSDDAWFNYRVEEFTELLDSLGVEYCTAGSDTTRLDYRMAINADKENLHLIREAIKQLRKTPDVPHPVFKPDEDSCEYSMGEVASILENILEQADPKWIARRQCIELYWI
jgi:hypothetical protein